MLSVFSCVYLLSLYLFWWTICSNPLSLLKNKVVFLLLNSENSLDILGMFFYKFCDLQIFSLSLWFTCSFSLQYFSKTRSSRRVVAKGEGVGGGVDWKFVISIYKLLYIEWINNKVLLYSIGNYIQCPVIINHNGREYEKRYICYI